MKDLCAFRKRYHSHIVDQHSRECARDQGSCQDAEDQHHTASCGDVGTAGLDRDRAECAEWEVKTLDVEHVWFYKWADFEVPSADFLGVGEWV